MADLQWPERLSVKAKNTIAKLGLTVDGVLSFGGRGELRNTPGVGMATWREIESAAVEVREAAKLHALTDWCKGLSQEQVMALEYLRAADNLMAQSTGKVAESQGYEVLNAIDRVQATFAFHQLARLAVDILTASQRMQ